MTLSAARPRTRDRTVRLKAALDLRRKDEPQSCDDCEAQGEHSVGEVSLHAFRFQIGRLLFEQPDVPQWECPKCDWTWRPTWLTVQLYVGVEERLRCLGKTDEADQVQRLHSALNPGS